MTNKNKTILEHLRHIYLHRQIISYLFIIIFYLFLKENKINILLGTNEERVEPNYMGRTQKAQKKLKSTKANKKGSLASLSMPKLSTKSKKYTLGSFKSECSTASKTLEFVSFHKHQNRQLRTSTMQIF